MTQRTKLIDLAAQLEPGLRSAFLAAVAELTSEAEVGRVTSHIEHGDVAAAIAALHIDPAAFSAVESQIAAAFERGGRETVAAFPRLVDGAGARVVVRFNMRNPRADAWLSNHSGMLIRQITDDQLAGVRVAMQAGLEAGRNPRSIALDIVGRMNRVTGRREGGLVGLTSSQMEAVARARAELLSGDKAMMQSYLGRARRDRRFDRQVMAAIREGRAVPADIAGRMVGRYADRLLLLRGETIARTEVLASLHQAQDEAFRQAVDTGVITQEQVRRAWHTAGDQRVRDSHRGMHGNSVGLNEPFISPSGARLMYPCDPAGPASETINCRCWVENRIDFLANIR